MTQIVQQRASKLGERPTPPRSAAHPTDGSLKPIGGELRGDFGTRLSSYDRNLVRAVPAQSSRPLRGCEWRRPADTRGPIHPRTVAEAPEAADPPSVRVR